ncbi:MAG TPA: glycine/sarcosine/betaine reductase selenoprotein B family protein [Nitrospirota bacterium]|nr:glycine/sarcosine/betaine reductase selenoprotein B family protein [Nitrospirota bacterium]
MEIVRLKNKMIAKVITRFPSLAKMFIRSHDPWESEDVPWTPVTKSLDESKVAIVTTAGVHHKDQTPFDMGDPDGDPSYRIIDIQKKVSNLMITHDYYDHSDADRDINIVFPIQRLQEFEKEGVIGRMANIHYSFMGHITDRHILTLISSTAPEVARRLMEDNVDAVLLTPG